MSRTVSAPEVVRGSAPETLFRQPPLVEWFRSLYQEVILLAERVRREPGSSAVVQDFEPAQPAPRREDAAETETEIPDEEPTVPSGAMTTAEIHARLLNHLETPPPGVSGPQVNEVLYAMAALADEVFIHLDWSGASSWRHHLLESALFDTHRAGEEIFRRIDHLIQHGDRSHRYAEVALVYLLLLALGFQGKYRGDPDARAIVDETRRSLYRFLTGRTPDDDDMPRVSPPAYAGVPVPGGPRPRMPYLRRWLWTLGAVVVLWLLVGHALWLHLTADLRPLLDRILG